MNIVAKNKDQTFNPIQDQKILIQDQENIPNKRLRIRSPSDDKMYTLAVNLVKRLKNGARPKFVGKAGKVFYCSFDGKNAVAKLFRDDNTTQGGNRWFRAFQDEINMLSQIPSHKALCLMFGHYRHAQYGIIAMPYTGPDLYELLRKNNNGLAPLQVRTIAKEVLSGLDFLHRETGIVHRDIKLENLTCDSTGQVRIIDFGLAQTGNSEGEFYDSIGTGGYMAPELWVEHPYSANVDTWALGVTLFSVAVGNTRPYVDPTDGSVIYKKNNGRYLSKYFDYYMQRENQYLYIIKQKKWGHWWRNHIHSARVLSQFDGCAELCAAKDNTAKKGTFFDLISTMLTYDAAERPTPAEILAENPWCAQETDRQSLVSLF